MRRQFEGEHLGEPDDRELGGRVAAVLRLGDAARERGNVDDAAAFALLDEGLGGCLAAVVDAVEVHIDFLDPLVVLHLPEVLLAGDERQPSVVHQGVDTPEFADRPLDHFLDGRGIRDIGIQRKRMTSHGFDLVRD